MKTVGELGEDGLIAQLCGGLSVSGKVVVGPGDDCAVVGEGDLLTLLKADAVVAGVHFLAGEDPRRVGWKAVARVLSDFAAMVLILEIAIGATIFEVSAIGKTATRIVELRMLTAAASEVGESVAQALRAANELSKQSEMLKVEVDKFMTQIRTA